MTPTSPNLTWRAVPGNQRAIVSTCGRFSIARITVNGADHFEVFRAPKVGDIWQRLKSTSVTGDGARAIAELVAGEPSPQASLL